MSHLHWMPLYIGDELAETAHLTAEEFGAYLSLKMHYWQHGGLPQDDRRLERIARCSSEQWALVRDAIMSLFYEGWRLPRLEEQRATAEETHQKRSEAGRKGGRPRKDEKPGYKPGFSAEKAGPKQPQPQPQPQPYSDPERNAESHPQGLALDEEGSKNPYTRAFPKPKSVDDGRVFLVERGCPPEQLKRCLGMLMDGHLAPFDIEDWDTNARNAA